MIYVSRKCLDVRDLIRLISFLAVFLCSTVKEMQGFASSLESALDDIQLNRVDIESVDTDFTQVVHLEELSTHIPKGYSIQCPANADLLDVESSIPPELLVYDQASSGWVPLGQNYVNIGKYSRDGKLSILVVGTGSPSTTMSLKSWEAFSVENREKGVFVGVYFSFVAVMLAIAAIMWLSYRDPIFGFYWLFVISVALAQSTTFGLLNPGSLGGIFHPQFIVPLTSFSCPLFTIALLQGELDWAGWREIGLLFIAGASLIGLVFLDGNVLYAFTNGVAGISAFYTLILAFSLRKGDQVAAARFIAVWLLFICGTICFVLSDTGVIEFNLWWTRFMNLGSLASMTLILFLLHARIRMNQNAVLKAQQFSIELMKQYDQDGLELRKLNSRGELLKSQMSPHFLYNSLAAIQGFVLSNERLASASYLAKYSALMRSFLRASRSEVIPLEHECSLLEDYLALSRLDSGGRLEYEVSISNEIEVDEIEIPPFLLQPFVENCLKHAFKGVNDRTWSIAVNFRRIEGDGIEIEIQDNGIGITDDEEQSERESYALKIIEERVQIVNAIGVFRIQYEVLSIGPNKGTSVIMKIF